jgi:predicted aconitase with swiveling domain
MKINPSAFLFSEHIDSLAASGIVLARIWEGSDVIAIDQLGDEFINTVKTGDKIQINNDGTVIVF